MSTTFKIKLSLNHENYFDSSIVASYMNLTHKQKRKCLSTSKANLNLDSKMAYQTLVQPNCQCLIHFEKMQWVAWLAILDSISVQFFSFHFASYERPMLFCSSVADSRFCAWLVLLSSNTQTVWMHLDRCLDDITSHFVSIEWMESAFCVGFCNVRKAFEKAKCPRFQRPNKTKKKRWGKNSWNGKFLLNDMIRCY